jgi:hypothetical protein
VIIRRKHEADPKEHDARLEAEVLSCVWTARLVDARLIDEIAVQSAALVGSARTTRLEIRWTWKRASDQVVQTSRFPLWGDGRLPDVDARMVGEYIMYDLHLEGLGD